MMWTFAAGAAFVVIGVLAVALHRQWRRSGSLQGQLQAAAANLEHLQRACARLAPAGVVQNVVSYAVRGLSASREPPVG